MAIDTGETKNSLFGGFKKAPKQVSDENLVSKNELQIKIDIDTEAVENENKIIQNDLSENFQIQPKWQTFDKVTALLTTEQKEGLDRVAKKLMKFRAKDLKGRDDKERITANTLIRALVENFLNLEDMMQLEVLNNEKDVQKWLKTLYKFTT
jgi:hypothetical protein